MKLKARSKEHKYALCNLVDGCKDSENKCIWRKAEVYYCFAWSYIDPFKVKLLEIKYSKNDKNKA